jgi:ceramide glucosyltransferase
MQRRVLDERMTLHVFIILGFALCLVSWLYWVAAWACLRWTLRRTARSELNSFEPLVSILKPIKGIDNGGLQNLASFCRQDFPNYELLFGVAHEKDPAVRIVERLGEMFPDLDIRLVIAQPLGTNPKAATLNTLVAEARADVLVISDSDIRVTPDYLKRVVAPLADENVGLVTCLYRGESPGNLPARLEALHMDTSFAPSAAIASCLGNAVGLGATLALRKHDLERAGGYAAIADHLLDDNEIAARIRGLGLKVQLSDYPVACLMGKIKFPQQWSREVRWSRGIRVAYPFRYLGVPITFSLPIAIATACLGFAWPWAFAALPIALGVRWAIGWQCAKLMGQRESGYLLGIPARDLLTAAVWTAAWFGRTVEWRGEEFFLRSDGTLRPKQILRLPRGPLAAAVRRLDAHLRKQQKVFEFTDDPRCILRVSVEPSPVGFTMADGTEVRPGDPLGVLHLWNEQLPIIPRTGPDLLWANKMRSQIRRSLAELANAVEKEPRLRLAKAFGGTALFVSRNGEEQIARFAGRYGFDFVPDTRRPTLWDRLHALGQNMLVLMLQWAFNPGGLRGKRLMLPREPLWISRQVLLSRHGATDETAADQARELESSTLRFESAVMK